MSSRTTCTTCGAERSDEKRPDGSVIPCPSYGSTAITMHDAATGSFTFDFTVVEELTPGGQDLDWKHRWSQIQRDLVQLLAPNTGEHTDALDHAFAKLQEFYVEAYHLKEALIEEAGALGLTRSQVESAINADPALTLLADLANTNKHAVLTKAPRSGDAPVFEPRSFQSPFPGLDHGWRLKAPISHNGTRVDGTQAAKDAVAAWGRQPHARGLT